MVDYNSKKIIIIAILIIATLSISIFLLINFFSKKSSIDKKQSLTTPDSKSEEKQQENLIEITPEPETEEEPYERNVETVENFYENNPLGKYLPYYTNHFEINYNGKIENGKAGYKIKLYVVLNRPSQFDNYKKDYLEYKIEAIEWIKSKGVDYKTLTIEWEPEDPKIIENNINSSNTNNSSQICQTCQ